MRYVFLIILCFSACRPAVDDNSPESAAVTTPGSITTTDIQNAAITPEKLSQAYLPLAGGTLTGALTLSADPSSSLHAATKQYVDGYLGGYRISSLSSIADSQYLAWSSTNSRWEPTTLSYIRYKGTAAAAADCAGTTNTNVMRFTTLAESSGSDITYVGSATDGDSFTINTSGIYTVSLTLSHTVANRTDAINVGAAINNVFYTTAHRAQATDSNAVSNSISWTGPISASQVVFIQSDERAGGGNYNGPGSADRNQITITRIR